MNWSSVFIELVIPAVNNTSLSHTALYFLVAGGLILEVLHFILHILKAEIIETNQDCVVENTDDKSFLKNIDQIRKKNHDDKYFRRIGVEWGG